MAQRNLFPTRQMPTTEHNSNAHLHLGAANGSHILPMDGSGSTAGLRSNDYPSSTFSNNMAPNLGPFRDPYLHLSSTASSSRFPQSFNQHGSSMAHHQSEIGRSTFKRKNPVIPPSYGGGNDSGCYNVGSSSSLHISSNPFHSQPMLMPQYPLLNPASIIRSYGSDNLPTAGDDSHRNVRSRHVQVNPALTYSSSSLPAHFRASGNLPGLTMDGQLNHVPIIPMASQGEARLNYETNQTTGGPAIFNSTIGTNGVFHPNLTQRRITNSLPTHEPLIRGVRASSNGYHQGSNSSRSSSSYNTVGFAPASLEVGGQSIMDSGASFGYSRPLSITGRSSYRNGRTRGSNSRFHSSYVEDSTRTRWSSEGAVLMDRSTFYDSRTQFDQHGDLRLDIDDMSYEELLALGERIGKVSTGLSEEAISGCLEETMHRCSPSKVEDDDEEVNCVICLEGYKDQDKLGRLNCRHDFHVGCIKNWLQIKNACPICKAVAAAASDGSSKEKQS